MFCLSVIFWTQFCNWPLYFNSLSFNSLSFNYLSFNSIAFNSLSCHSLSCNSLFNSLSFISAFFNSSSFNSLSFNSLSFNSLYFNSLSFNLLSFNYLLIHNPVIYMCECVLINFTHMIVTGNSPEECDPFVNQRLSRQTRVTPATVGANLWEGEQHNLDHELHLIHWTLGENLRGFNSSVMFLL